ncbi:MAG: ABC transporter permease [Deltaproteobacteria bacterium]|jgi:NitT/TauT family transport system permease protein
MTREPSLPAGVASAPNSSAVTSGSDGRHRARIRGALTFLWLALAWELVARYVVRDERMLAPFSQVISALVKLFVSGEIWKHLSVSGYEFALGFVLASLAGIAVGLLMGTVSLVREYLDPWISGLYAAPLVALAPFYIMFFGVGIAAKVALVFSVVFFPVVVNTYTGIYSVDPGMIEVARSFNASRAQILFKVLIPFSLTYIVTGLRLGVGRGLTGVVVGEFFFANAGLGFLVALAGQTFNTPLLFAGVLVFAVAGIALIGGLKRLEQKLAPWRASNE